MSATNRSNVRHPDDFYRTPKWCTELLMDYLSLPKEARILDIAAGDGAILDVFKEKGHHTYGIEINEQRCVDANENHIMELGDYLETSRFEKYVVVTNPPYKLAMEFMSKAVKENEIVCSLLRLPWLASSKRKEWLKKNTPTVAVLSKRPSFTGNGTDATDYAWMIWNGESPKVVIL